MLAYLWDIILFLKNWIFHPLQMGTIFPSSPRTGKLIGDLVQNPSQCKVVELGAGTGQVTEWLSKEGIKKENFISVEYDKGFYKELKRKFPTVNFLNIDAAELLEKIPPEFIGKTDYVISTLPLIPMPKEQQLKILNATFKLLKPEGKLYQVSLSLRKPKYFDELGLESKHVLTSWLNLPPMFVYELMEGNLKKNN